MSNQLRAVFIDDDPLTLGVLERMLRNTRGRIEPVFVDNGNDPVEMLAFASYDVVVTDIGMPGMSGLEVLEIVADEHPDMPRLVLSGKSARSDTLQAAGLAHQHLVKPCNSDGLTSAIQRSVRKRRRWPIRS